MKKKFLVVTLLVSLSLLGVLSLNAANNRIQVVSENYAPKQLSQDGTRILNRINTATSDLINGEVNIEITIDNSKDSKVFYVFDNGTTAATTKNSLIDQLKAESSKLKMMNVSEGLVVHQGDSLQTTTETTDMSIVLETVKNLNTTDDGKVFEALSRAADELIASNSTEKTLVVFVNSLSNVNSSTWKANINNYIAKGIKIIAYGINLGGQANTFNDIFSAVTETKYLITTAEISSKINFATNVASTLPSAKQNVDVTISYDTILLNNFNIKPESIATTVGTASYDPETKLLTWKPETVGINQKAVLTYTLSLKNAVDPDIVDKINLRTNRQIIVNGKGPNGEFMGKYPDPDRGEDIEETICSPTIKILQEAVDNPKTGIANYMISGICMIAVGSITLLILSRKNQFSRI